MVVMRRDMLAGLAVGAVLALLVWVAATAWQAYDAGRGTLSHHVRTEQRCAR